MLWGTQGSKMHVNTQSLRAMQEAAQNQQLPGDGPECFMCSNCKTAKNGQQEGHGTSDHHCPVFLE